MDIFTVAVMPLDPKRWMSVVEGPTGDFAVTSTSPRNVIADVYRAVSVVLGWASIRLEFVDDLGDTWTPSTASAQLQRLQPGHTGRIQRVAAGLLAVRTN